MSALDPVQLAVLSNRFDGIVRSMVNTLVRTGRSGVLNTARDLSCCILTRTAELLAIAESAPIHVLSSDLMARSMTELHLKVRRGDAFLHNSPYHGTTHAADHALLVPVVDEDGVHRFTVLAKAHQADCGNAQPTTYSASARDVYEEGALIFPCVRVQSDYRDCEDIIRMCKMRIRVPEQWWGDYLALVGAARVGEREVEALGQDVGWDTLELYVKEWFDFSEDQAVHAIQQLPSGQNSIRTTHDPFPGVPEGIAVQVGLAIDADAGRIEIDLRDNPDCQPCGLNLSEATAIAAAMTGVFNGLPAIPVNAGAFRRIDVRLRENCVVGRLRHPASGSVATTNLADRVANAVQRGLAEFADGYGMAEIGLSQSPALAVVSGRDPRRGNALFVNQLILPALTGGAGSPHADGWLTLGNASSVGVMFRDSVEMDELKQPIIIHSQSIAQDTEGPGRFRGAPGAYVEYGPLETSIDVSYLSDGTIFPALGVRGGGEGGRANQWVRHTDGETVRAEACALLTLAPGESVISLSCGGGGYGSPLERDPARVARDVSEGWISRTRAREIYGVAVTSSGEIDHTETMRLRGDTNRSD